MTTLLLPTQRSQKVIFKKTREKAYYFAPENENSKSLCSSNFISHFLKRDLYMD